MKCLVFLSATLAFTVAVPAFGQDTDTKPTPKYRGKVVTKPLTRTPTTQGTMKSTDDDQTLLSPSRMVTKVGQQTKQLDSTLPKIPEGCAAKTGTTATVSALYLELQRSRTAFAGFKQYVAQQFDTDNLDFALLAASFVKAPSLAGWNKLVPYITPKGQKALNIGGGDGGGKGNGCTLALIANYVHRIEKGLLRPAAPDVKGLVSFAHTNIQGLIRNKLLEWRATDDGARLFPAKKR